MIRRHNVENFLQLCEEALEESRATANEDGSSPERNSRVHCRLNEGSNPPLVQASASGGITDARTDKPANSAEHLNSKMMIAATNSASPYPKIVSPDIIPHDVSNDETPFNFTGASAPQWIDYSNTLSTEVFAETDVQWLPLDPDFGSPEARSIDDSGLSFSWSQSGQRLLVIY